jgi:hypothetical protein
MTVLNPILVAANERRAQLEAELANVVRVIESISGTTQTVKSASSKRGRPKRAKNKAAAPKATRKAKPKTERKASGGKRGRPKGSRNRSTNGISLMHAVAQVLAEANEPMSVSDIIAGVEKLGYTSNAASFNVMVSQTLGKLSEAKVAENVKHGVWQSSNGITKFLESFNATEEQVAATDPSLPV